MSDDDSIELPGGDSGRRTFHSSSRDESNRDNSVSGLKYVSGRRSSTKGRKKDKKEKRRGSRSGSGSDGGGGGSKYLNDRTNKSMSALGVQDAQSSLSKVTPDNYYDDPSVPSAYASYADNKYIKKPTPPAPEQEQDSLLQLDTPSANIDPDDPLANLKSYGEELFQDECSSMRSGEGGNSSMEAVDLEDKRRNFNRFSNDSSNIEKRRGCEKVVYFLKYYWGALLMFILFLFGLVALILYMAGVGNKFESFNNNNAFNKQTPQPVPLAPLTLNFMCDPSSAAKVNNQIELPKPCVSACLKAECCWNPNGEFVCTEETKDHCLPFAQACGQWKDTLTVLPASGGNDNEDATAVMEVPLFPAGLTTTCDRTAYEVALDCRQGCAEAECCWDKTITVACSKESLQNCGNYKEVCDFLNDEEEAPTETASPDAAKTWPFPEAPKGLNVYCDPAEMEEVSLHICQDKCKEGMYIIENICFPCHGVGG